MKKKQGISLIVLIITIIVIIILAGSVIVSLSDNNPIENAKEASFKKIVEQYNSELSIALSNEYLKDNLFDPSTFNKGIWDGGEIEDTIKKYVPSMKTTDGTKFEIQAGQLVYVGLDETEEDWFMNINILNETETTQLDTIETFENGISNTVYNYIGDWGIISNNAYEGNYCYSNKDISDNEMSSSTFSLNVPDDGYDYKLSFYYKTITEYIGDFFRVYINGTLEMEDYGNSLSYIYYDKVLPSGNNTIEFRYEKNGFYSHQEDCIYIDNIQLKKGDVTSPVFMSSPSGYTTGNVTVTIAYSPVVATKQYSLDGVTWYTYTSPIVVSTNNSVIYAKGLDNDGNQNCQSTLEVSNILVPDEIVSTVQIENKTFAGESTGYLYNNPVIPAGFVALNTSAANWNKLSTDWNRGLVIQDSTGNQFVWVPVDGTYVTYSRWSTLGTVYATTNDTLPTGITNETDQITTYGGFYIARYESGKESTDILVSKKNTTTWTINYATAKTKSESMYITDEIRSGLVTGRQWDSVMKWIQNSGNSIANSTTWGNYLNSAYPADVSGYGNRQVTGYSEYWKAKNIYDLAGNLYEWTSEIYASQRVVRGGMYSDYGSGYDYPVTYASPFDPVLSYISFRVVLYIL